MIIANPIYDVVFKRMMENEKVAKFFIGTLLDEEIESITFKPQEYTFEGEFDLSKPEDVAKYENRIKERFSIWVLRVDFIATIRKKNGEVSKVLIEIQKARTEVDLMRFRNYLAEHYKKIDVIDDKKVILPITTIYILGFPLPEIKTPCLKVERNYKNLIDNSFITTTSEFVERLTHDSYIVQVGRIKGKYQTKLEKLLSIFEQANFVDDKNIIKEFNYEIDMEEIKLMTDILHYTGTDPKEKKEIENEEEAWRTIDVVLEATNEKYYNAVKEINVMAKKIEDGKKELEQNEKQLVENEKQLVENEKQLEQNEKQLEQNEKQLEQNEKQLEQNEKQLVEAKKEADDAKKEADDAKKEADDAKKEADDAKKEADDAKKEADEKDKLIQELLKKLEGK
jgi:Alanine-zipper, major outer membrane lipoprotein